MQTGDTYERIQEESRDKNIKFSNNFQMNYNFRMVQLTLQHSFLYQDFDMTSALESETRSDSLLNKYFTRGLTKGHDLKTGLQARALIKFKDNTSDHVETTASVIYSHRKSVQNTAAG